MNPKVYTLPFLAVISILFITGCENSFEPKAEFREELVVYGVLSNALPTQVIRLESTYDAELTNPEDALYKRIIEDADVYVAQTDGHEYKFNKEEITGQDGIKKYIWTNSEIKPTPVKYYRLRVVMNGETVAKSDMQVPSRPFLEMASQTGGEGRKAGIAVRAGGISTAATPKGFYFRLYVVGYTYSGPDTLVYREEVPYAFDPDIGEDGQYVYSKPSRESELVFGPNLAKRAKDLLLSKYPFATNFDLEAVGISMDTHFYNYYKVVRGFDDPVSIRQDLPNISNISGGLGVFGAMTSDTEIKKYASLIR